MNIAAFPEQPAVLFEVLSQATRRLDENEKEDAYLTIASLQVYVLLEQDTPAAIVWRRTSDGLVRGVHTGLDAVAPLAEVGIDLPLAEAYDGVVFLPEASADE